jgi:thiol-disulfide isomerase/thioredoxin
VKNLTVVLFISTLLCFTGCEEKKEKNTINMSEKNALDIVEANSSLKKEATLKTEPSSKKFTLSNIDNKTYTFYFDKKDILIDNISQNFVLLNFFATWCPPCNGQLPYISDINKKYKDKLFVAGILVNDADKEYHQIEKLIKEYEIDYFISNSKQNDDFAMELLKNLNISPKFQLPLTILFKNGKYYAHYEGATPIEMIEYDINKAMKNKEK